MIYNGWYAIKPTKPNQTKPNQKMIKYWMLFGKMLLKPSSEISQKL